MGEPTPATLEFVSLAADESPPHHPCAAVELYESDIALLNYLLQDLRVIARQHAHDPAALVPYEPMEWSVHGLGRRTVICDPDALVSDDDVLVVGFFGDRRPDLDDEDVDTTELAVMGGLRTNPGIISYSSIELMDEQWANLVVHRETGDRERWRHSAEHIDAAERFAPLIYRSVRIHNGCIPNGPIGSDTVVIETTKYWDYDTDPVWVAQRVLPGGATEVLDSPTQP